MWTMKQHNKNQIDLCNVINKNRLPRFYKKPKKIKFLDWLVKEIKILFSKKAKTTKLDINELDFFEMMKGK